MLLPPSADQRVEYPGFTVSGAARAGGLALTVEPIDGSLISCLRDSGAPLLPRADGRPGCWDDEGDEDSPLRLDAQALLHPDLGVKMTSWNRHRDDREVAGFLHWLPLAAIALDTKRRARIEHGTEVGFEELGWVFRAGTEVVVSNERSPWAGRVVEGQVVTGFSGRAYQLKIAVVSAHSGLGAGCYHRTALLRDFEGYVALDSLHVRVLTPAVRETLTARGRRYRHYAQGVVYAAYAGDIAQPGWFGDRHLRADGRVVIDGASIRQFESDLADGLFRSYRPATGGYDGGYGSEDEEGVARGATIGDDDLWRTPGVLPAFSFRAKAWGGVLVEGLSDITFRTDAFERLVLDAELKQTMLALVKHAGHAFTDVVDGKGGGTIFLLHGPPGQGKTLSAETIAEVLERPLYAISIGELGTTPEALEERLREILDLATRWNAVLLLDEADIFLERRNERDVVRNAMVGVFLRLLEYHDGVLFLTTNRVRQFDPAFHSRVSLAIHYPAADASHRAAIWASLLRASRLEHLDAAAFASADLNGRQIKNVLRLAQTLARSEGVEVSEAHVRRTMAFSERFSAHLSETPAPAAL